MSKCCGRRRSRSPTSREPDEPLHDRFVPTERQPRMSPFAAPMPWCEVPLETGSSTITFDTALSEFGKMKAREMLTKRPDLKHRCDLEVSLNGEWTGADGKLHEAVWMVYAKTGLVRKGVGEVVLIAEVPCEIPEQMLLDQTRIQRMPSIGEILTEPKWKSAEYYRAIYGDHRALRDSEIHGNHTFRERERSPRYNTIAAEEAALHRRSPRFNSVK